MQLCGFAQDCASTGAGSGIENRPIRSGAPAPTGGNRVRAECFGYFRCQRRVAGDARADRGKTAGSLPGFRGATGRSTW